MPLPLTPTKHPKFINPHEGLECKRLNVDTSLAIHNFIKRIRINEGTNTNTVNLLLQKTYDALVLRNITDFTSIDEFERFIAECIVVHPSEVYFKLDSGLHLDDSTDRVAKRSTPVLAGSPQFGTGADSLHGGTGSRLINPRPNGSDESGRVAGEDDKNARVTHKSTKLLRGDKTRSGGSLRKEGKNKQVEGKKAEGGET